MEKIVDDIYFIQGNNQGKYPFSNSLLIKENNNILIDAGLGNRIIRKILKNNQINKVLLSHNHEDHISGLKYLKDAQIFIHNLDKKGVESIKYLQYIYGLDDSYEKEFKSFIESLGVKEIIINKTFKGGEKLKINDIEIEIIHTPGHSAGHSCFYIKPYRIMFLSDIDLSSFGPWYGSIDGNIEQFIQSIKKILNYKIDYAVSSHKGLIVGDIKDRLIRFLNKIYEREKLILENIGNGITIEELVEKALIYGKFPEPKELFVMGERLMIEKHLNKLLRERKLIKINEKYIKI